MDAFSTEKDSLRWNRFAEQAGFELRVKNWRCDGYWQWQWQMWWQDEMD